jgi:hypothetical protein
MFHHHVYPMPYSAIATPPPAPATKLRIAAMEPEGTLVPIHAAHSTLAPARADASPAGLVTSAVTTLVNPAVAKNGAFAAARTTIFTLLELDRASQLTMLE